MPIDNISLTYIHLYQCGQFPKYNYLRKLKLLGSSTERFVPFEKSF